MWPNVISCISFIIFDVGGNNAITLNEIWCISGVIIVRNAYFCMNMKTKRYFMKCDIYELVLTSLTIFTNDHSINRGINRGINFGFLLRF